MTEPQAQYKVTNWSEYNKSLVKRGSLTLGIPEDVSETWYAPVTAKQGRPKTYSDLAMELCFALKCAYNLTYRATEGFATSIFPLGGI